MKEEDKQRDPNDAEIKRIPPSKCPQMFKSKVSADCFATWDSTTNPNSFHKHLPRNVLSDPSDQ